MGKKKPFIDKKKASVYHVVRRSQRDVGTEATADTLSDFVLMPSPDNERKKERARTDDTEQDNTATNTSTQTIKKNSKVDFNTLKSQITTLGLADDQSSTYTKYTKPIDQSGTFLPSNILHSEDATNLSNLFTDTSKNDMDTALQEAMEVHEVGRQLDSIALSADCMEEDMAHALFDFEEGEFEEILDDFCFTANQEVLEDDEGDGAGGEGRGEFNYEQHIQMLMEKARQQENGGGEVGRSIDHDVFEGVTPLHGRIEEVDDEEDEFDYDQYDQEEEEDEDSLDREFNGEEDTEYNAAVQPSLSTAAPAINDEEQRVLCQKFEETLLEYDSDDMGDLDEECEEIVGDRPLEGDVQLEAALDEFLTEKQDDILIEGTTNKHDKVKRTGGSGYSALVGKTMVNASGLQYNDPNYDESKALLINIEESKRQMKQDLAEADAILANPEIDLPPEEVFIDGKSYFTETSRSQWDCESILSTYSNLDNNPVVIGRKKKKKKKKKGSKDANGGVDAIPEEGPVKIQLSNKTGLPLGTFDNQYSSQQSPEDEEDDAYDNEYYNESDTYISINRGEARNKAETKMEKKQRKVAIKEERKICRMQKKIMKEAFKEEFIKRGQDVVVNDVGGSTVFRFS